MNQHKELFTKIITSLDELVNEIDRPLSGNFPTVYRGQANADWPILSSFYRWYQSKYKAATHSRHITDIEEINKGSAINIDPHYFDTARSIIDTFKAKVGDIVGLESTYANLNYIGQHYSIPTNLIDFTYDPYVALFFAMNFEQTPSSGYVSLYKTTPTVFAQGAIQNITRHHFVSSDELVKEITSLNSNDRTIKLPRLNIKDLQSNIRIQAQKGCFVYFPYNFSYEKIMYEMECWQPTGGWGSQKKWNIPISLKPEIVSLLESKGITKRALYPKVHPSELPANTISLDSYLKKVSAQTLNEINAQQKNQADG